MSAVTALFYFTLMFDVFVSADLKIIRAQSVQNVTLTCRAPNNNMIAVKWSRSDLEDKYVFLCRDGHFDQHYQHPSFKNRVDLQDRQMKDGDVSLILKDVTINDAGTYECRVFTKETLSWKFISIIYLSVVDPPGHIGRQGKDEDNKDGGKEDRGKEDGSVELTVFLSASAVLLFATNVVFVFWIYTRIQRVCKTYIGQGSTEQLYPSQKDSDSDSD